jgi:hypothetical protein
MVASKETVVCARAMRRRTEHLQREKVAGRKLIATRRSRFPAERESWRRLTSMTLDLEPFMDDQERRAGLKRLVDWIEETILHRRDAETDGTALRIEDCEMRISNLDGGAETDSASEIGGEDAATTAGGTPALRMLASWDVGVEKWERVRADGFSIEALCARLGISHGRLSQLTKEFCNLSAQELVDGFKLRGSKNFLIGRFRSAAWQLWGRPGAYAEYKVEGFLDCEGRKRSEFFRFHREDASGETEAEERFRRIGELVARMQRDLDLSSWAIECGFASGSKLKRACLTVFGRTLEQIERLFAVEVVDYFLCAEDRELRRLAQRDPVTPALFRARIFYHNSEETPMEPFADRWSLAEFAARGWLEGMAGAFG